MSAGLGKFYKLGGISFMASACLFLAKSVLELLLGPPPSTGLEILAWVAAQKTLLAVTNEVLFFAVMFLVPGVLALHDSLAGTQKSTAALGCGILALTIPGLYVLAIVHGRLVFPVYQIQVHSPEVAEFVVATYYGGLHAMADLFAVATFVLSLAMRHAEYGSKVATLGFVTAVCDVLGSYPWATGPISWLLSGIVFAAWFLVIGIKLYGLPAAARH